LESKAKLQIINFKLGQLANLGLPSSRRVRRTNRMPCAAELFTNLVQTWTNILILCTSTCCWQSSVLCDCRFRGSHMSIRKERWGTVTSGTVRMEASRPKSM